MVSIIWSPPDFFQYFKDDEIDSCSWNYSPNMTDGKLGVDCPNLEELKAHVDKMEEGQKITCKRFLKNRDSIITYIIYDILYHIIHMSHI